MTKYRYQLVSAEILTISILQRLQYMFMLKSGQRSLLARIVVNPVLVWGETWLPKTKSKTTKQKSKQAKQKKTHWPDLVTTNHSTHRCRGSNQSRTREKLASAVNAEPDWLLMCIMTW